MHLRDGIRLPVVTGVSFALGGRRMRRARRPVGRRQELDPENALRQLCASMPARSSSTIEGELVDLAARQPAHGARRPARHDRLCQPVPAHGAARLGARRGRRAAGRARRATARRRASTAPRTAGPPQSAGAAVVAAARHLLRRRAAARQHRPRLHHRPSDPAARRADRLARCHQPRGGDRHDRREESGRASRCSASSTMPTCATQSPTASSTSPNSPPEGIAA